MKNMDVERIKISSKRETTHTSLGEWRHYWHIWNISQLLHIPPFFKTRIDGANNVRVQTDWIGWLIASPHSCHPSSQKKKNQRKIFRFLADAQMDWHH
jgi:hypothetical protein